MKIEIKTSKSLALTAIVALVFSIFSGPVVKYAHASSSSFATLDSATSDNGSLNTSSNPTDAALVVSGTWASISGVSSEFEAGGAMVYIDGVHTPPDITTFNGVSTDPTFTVDVQIPSSVANGTHTVQLYPYSSETNPNDGTAFAPTNALTFYVQHASPPPSNPPATITVTPDRLLTWSITGSPTLCGAVATCTSASTVSYSFDASSFPTHTISGYGVTPSVTAVSVSNFDKFLAKIIHTAEASTGSGGTCNSTPGGTCAIQLQSTYCTINITGIWNPSNNNSQTVAATGVSFSLIGANNYSGTNNQGTNTIQALADSGGTSYTFSSSAASGVTVNSVNSDVYDQNTAASTYGQSNTQTCSPGGTINFKIYSQSRAVLDVH